MKRAFSYMNRAMQDKKSLTNISYDLKKMIAEYPGLNKNERSMLYWILYKTCRACKLAGEDYKRVLGKVKIFDDVLRVFRKVYRNDLLRKKRRWTRAALRSKDFVFFMCSMHSHPAKDHKDYQGKIYVDRYWREKTKGNNYNAVLNYIKQNGTITVQKIQGDPVYLTTRPYCRHYFIPVDTAAVLTGATKGITIKHTYKPFDAEDYYNFRGQVFDKLNKETPCYEYGKIKKRPL